MKKISSTFQNKQAITVGNFICSHLDWSLINGDQEGSGLTEMADDPFLRQVVTQATCENNILNLVLVNDLDPIRDCEAGGKLIYCSSFTKNAKNWDNHISSGVIYLNFQNVFGKVLHEQLRKKLETAGIGANLTAQC